MRIIFDIDGVVRDLTGKLCEMHNLEYPETYFQTHDGKTYRDYLDLDLTVFQKAEPTEYCKIVKNYGNLLNNAGQKLIFWTYQYCDLGKQYTTEWIEKNFNGINYEIHFKTPEEKIDSLGEFDFLVEDSSELKNYDNIILIQTAYNKDTKCKRIVKNEEELSKYLGLYYVEKGFKYLEFDYASIHCACISDLFRNYMDNLDSPFRIFVGEDKILFKKI